MYCAKCGTLLQNEAKFCVHCGQPVGYSAAKPQPQNAITTKKQQYKTLLIAIAVVIVGIIAIIWCVDYFSIENQLTRNVWWSKVDVDQEYGDWSDYDYGIGYKTRLECKSLTFYEWGKSERCNYGYPGLHDSYYSFRQEPISTEMYPDLDWSSQKDDSEIYDETKSARTKDWEILDNKVLHWDDDYYKWSKTKAKDTWYLSGNELRIGNTYYTSNSPVGE